MHRLARKEGDDRPQGLLVSFGYYFFACQLDITNILIKGELDVSVGATSRGGKAYVVEKAK